MTYTYLKNAGFLAGSAIDLNGRVATFDFNNFVISRDFPAKDVGSSYDFRLGEVDYTGHANPNWIVQGYIPSGITTNQAGSFIATFPRLGSLCMLGSPCVFYDHEFSLNPAGSTWVLPKSLKVEKDSKSSGYKYTLGLVETQEW